VRVGLHMAATICVDMWLESRGRSPAKRARRDTMHIWGSRMSESTACALGVDSGHGSAWKAATRVKLSISDTHTLSGRASDGVPSSAFLLPSGARQGQPQDLVGRGEGSTFEARPATLQRKGHRGRSDALPTDDARQRPAHL